MPHVQSHSNLAAPLPQAQIGPPKRPSFYCAISVCEAVAARQISVKKRSVQVVHEHSELRSNNAAATQLAYLIQSSTGRTLLDLVKSCAHEHPGSLSDGVSFRHKKGPPKRPFLYCAISVSEADAARRISVKKRSVQVVHEHSELRSNNAAATQLAYLIQSSTGRTLLGA